MKTSPKRMKKKLKRGQKKEKQKCNRNAGTDSNGLCMNNKCVSFSFAFRHPRVLCLSACNVPR